MPKLPIFSGREAMAALTRAGFVSRHRKSTHVTMIHPVTKRRVTVPDTSDDLDRGMCCAIIRQAGLTVAEFIELLK